MAAKLKKAQADLAAAKAAVAAARRSSTPRSDWPARWSATSTSSRPTCCRSPLLVGHQLHRGPADPAAVVDHDVRHRPGRDRRLTVIQRQLDAAKARQAALEAQVAADRREAAANLQGQARPSRRGPPPRRPSVARLLAQRQAHQRAAANDVAEDKARYAKLTRERASVEQRIAVRIAKAKAAAARGGGRQRAAQRPRRARPRRRRARRRPRAAARQQSQLGQLQAPRPAASAGADASSSGSGGVDRRPRVLLPGVARRSPRRTGCASTRCCTTGSCTTAPTSAPAAAPPIRAPYSGRVAERYYNAGYGNRLMIDHGYVGGQLRDHRLQPRDPLHRRASASTSARAR